MKVWVVYTAYDSTLDQPPYIFGFFTSLDRAEEAKSAIKGDKKNHIYDELYIKEFKLNEIIKGGDYFYCP